MTTQHITQANQNSQPHVLHWTQPNLLPSAAMPRQKIDDEIEALRRQRSDLDARLKAAEDRRKKSEAEQNDRRKMLLGDLILRFMLQHPDDELAAALRAMLTKQAVRTADRELLQKLISSQAQSAK